MDLFDWKGFLLLAAIFVPLERLLAMHPEQKLLRRGWSNDLVYVVVNALLIKAGGVALFVGAVVLTEGWVPESLRTALSGQPVWLQFLQVLLVADVGFYLVHRLFHKVPWLWRFHAVHHSIEELDWLAAHRVHPVDQLLTKSASFLPCILLGYSEVAIGAYVLVYHWHSILLHANIRLPFGPLRWLVASPEFHHWHHSDHREAYDKNFAGQLAFLDVLFGTAHMTHGTTPTKYGCSDRVPPTYLAQLAYPFRRWFAPKRGRRNAQAHAPATAATMTSVPVAAERS